MRDAVARLRARGRVHPRAVARFLVFAGRRFAGDDGPRLAAGLSYASLLALVPLLVIALATVSAFPAFQDVEAALLAGVRDAVPSAGAEAARWISGFLDRAKGMTGPGILALVAVAVLLLNNINGAFNAIWRVSEPRPWPIRLLVYWALLTLGPMLLGTTISLSGTAFGDEGKGLFTGAPILARVTAVALLGVGLGVIYFVVPNRGVHPWHALIGGGLAAALFQLTTFVFGVYLANFPAYEAIYGAFSTLPIFLVWLFLSWCAVLIGAEITAALPEWRATWGGTTACTQPGARLALALTLLGRLNAARAGGGPRKRRALAGDLPAPPSEVDATLKRLRDRGYVARSLHGQWILARDLARVSLRELLTDLGLGLDPGRGWPESAGSAAAVLDRAAAGETARPIGELLSAVPERTGASRNRAGTEWDDDA